MELVHLILLQITAHLLCDFVFQPHQSAEEKNENGFKSKFLKWHILITFTFSWILSFQWLFILAALVIAASHWLVDGFKKKMLMHPMLGKHAFFIDQFLHLIIIVAVVWAYHKVFGIAAIFDLTFSTKYLMIAAGYVLCLKPTNIIIKETLIAFDIKLTDNYDLPNAGKLIGIIERLLVFTFVLLNQYAAVGFLVTAKSILRFKADDTLKTEYVLIGTLLSFGIAIMAGVVVNFLK